MWINISMVRFQNIFDMNLLIAFLENFNKTQFNGGRKQKFSEVDFQSAIYKIIKIFFNQFSTWQTYFWKNSQKVSRFVKQNGCR